MKFTLSLIFWVTALWAGSAPALPQKPLPAIVDQAGLFQPLTVQEQAAEIQAIFVATGLKIRVRTVKTVPYELASQAEKFRLWVEEAFKPQGEGNISIFISANPALLSVSYEPALNLDSRFTEQEREALTQLISQQMRTGADDALVTAVNYVRNRLTAKPAITSSTNYPRLSLLQFIGLLLCFNALVGLALRKAKVKALGTTGAWIFFSSFCLLWTFSHWDLFVSSSQFLPRDNRDHFFGFWYVAKYITFFKAMPTWFFSQDGGLWLNALTNHFHLLVPYRLIGYALVALTNIDPNTAYKISFLIFGQGVFLFGLYRVSRFFLKSSGYSTLLLATALVTSVGVTLFHQEQALCILFYIPFLWICVLKAKENVRYVPLFFALLGLAVNNDYPHYQMIYWPLVAFLGLTLVPECRLHLTAIRAQVKKAGTTPLLIVSLAAFLIGASPLIYSYAKYRHQVASSFRGQGETVEAQTFDDYLKMAALSAGVYPPYLKLYLTQETKHDLLMERLDSRALFITPAALLAAILLFGLKIPGKRFHIAMLVSLAVLCTGIYGPAPRLLWPFLPGISLFRQWYFFISFFNLHALLAVFIVLKSAVETPLPPAKYPAIFPLAIVMMVLVATGLLAPLAGIPAALLLVLKWAQEKGAFYGPSALLGVALVWIFGGSLLWAYEALDIYRGAVKTNNEEIRSMLTLPLETNEADRFASYLFFDRNYAFKHQLPLANPRGLDPAQVRVLSLHSGLFWLADSNLIKAEAKDFRVSPADQEIRLDILRRPAAARSLLMLQFNDGGWKIDDQNGSPLSPQKGPLGLVMIPLTSQPTGLTLGREPSLWTSLIFLMWLPALLLGFSILLQEAQWRFPSVLGRKAETVSA